MADTQRTLTAIYALLADNTDGDISAQDLRDAVITLSADHGEMYISSSSATTLGTLNQWYDASGTWTLTSSPAAMRFDMNSNGQLRYTGTPTRVFHVAASFSATSAGSNKTYEFGIGINGTVSTPSIVRRKITTGTDVGTGALHGFVELSTNDYVTFMLRNITDTTNATLELGNMFAMGMPQ